MAGQRVKFHNSISFKISAIVAAILSLSIIGLSVINAMSSFERETANFESLTKGAASAYSAAIAEPVSLGDKQQTLFALRGIRELPNIVQADVTLVNDRLFVQLGSGAWLLREERAETSLWSTGNVRVEIPIVKDGVQIGTLGMLADVSPLRSEILSNLIKAILSAVVIALLGIVAAQMFIGRITSPLRDLTDIMVNVRDGNAPDDFDIQQRSDETGILTNTFQDMISAIAMRDNQIAQHMETLEQTVEARTLDLRVARDEAEVARDEAEAANSAKSEFLATMSHEIRTPMNGMIVMAEMLGAADLSSRHKRYAEIIRRSGNGLLTIINDILDLSKIEAGQLDLESIPLSPEELATDVASLFWERARLSKLELATYVSPAVPDEILGDPTRINQIVSNLVNNALKFTEAGGVLIRLDATTDAQAGDVLQIDVVDTGIGIAEDKIDHVFESFSQADQSTTRKFGGTGLGLTVCRRLVDAMNGSISVTSELGKGSIFSVSIPVQVLKPHAQIQNSALKVGLRIKEGVVRNAINDGLIDYGIETSCATPDVWIASSKEYVDCETPTVILSDIGDTRADNLLISGKAQDLIPLPFRRTDLQDFLQRAGQNSLRGADALSQQLDEHKSIDLTGLRILAVDDNAVNREVLREALTTLNAQAVFAEDGAQALELFEQDQFDAVLMDGSMPVMDGFEATQLMRKLELTQTRQRTPIYALTAQVAGTDGSAWEEVGADGHILKPFTLEKLSDVLARHALSPVSDSSETQSNNTLNLETIYGLEHLGSAPGGVRDKVWDVFRQKAPLLLSDLHQSVELGDTSQIAFQAHAMKSMALSSGFEALSNALQGIESGANGEADLEAISSQARELQALLAETNAAMIAYQSDATAC